MQYAINDNLTNNQTSAADDSLHTISKEDENRFYIHKLLYNKNLMIEQCNTWLPAEEGLKNMEKQMKRKKIANNQ